MKSTVALILSGSGHIDGAEITEAVSLNIALVQNGFKVDFYAPNRDQLDVINHLTQTPQTETRNILTESARIARGKIKALEALNVSNYSAIVMAGGFGAVKNFTTFLTMGVNATLYTDIKRVLLDALKARIPLVGICAAPLPIALAVKEFGQKGQEISFGAAAGATDFTKVTDQWGAIHIETAVNEAHIDTQYRLITSGAYMFSEASAAEVFESAQASIVALKKLIA